jgi:xanthine dehydrogenase accessory factor
VLAELTSVNDTPPSAYPTFFSRLAELEAAGSAFVLVVLVEALGSTPQDTGAKMLVGPTGLIVGTIGGGRVEARAISLAQDLLKRPAVDRAQPTFVSWTLKGDVGMTCGGSVKLYFEPHPGAGTLWPIAIFGAGHVTRALLPVLQPLPCSATIYDTRADWTARVPRAPNVRVELVDDLPSVIDRLPNEAFVLCLTQGHKTDRPILFRALSTKTFPYVGCIGSEAKAHVLRQELISDGLTVEQANSIHCPIGLDFGTNHPHEIALSIAAQLLTVRDR